MSDGIKPINTTHVGANMPFVGRSLYKDYGNYGPSEVDYESLGLYKKFGKPTYKYFFHK